MPLPDSLAWWRQKSWSVIFAVISSVKCSKVSIFRIVIASTARKRSLLSVTQKTSASSLCTCTETGSLCFWIHWMSYKWRYVSIHVLTECAAALAQLHVYKVHTRSVWLFGCLSHTDIESWRLKSNDRIESLSFHHQIAERLKFFDTKVHAVGHRTTSFARASDETVVGKNGKNTQISANKSLYLVNDKP